MKEDEKLEIISGLMNAMKLPNITDITDDICELHDKANRYITTNSTGLGFKSKFLVDVMESYFQSYGEYVTHPYDLNEIPQWAEENADKVLKKIEGERYHNKFFNALNNLVFTETNGTYQNTFLRSHDDGYPSNIQEEFPQMMEDSVLDVVKINSPVIGWDNNRRKYSFLNDLGKIIYLLRYNHDNKHKENLDSCLSKIRVPLKALKDSYEMKKIANEDDNFSSNEENMSNVHITKISESYLEARHAISVYSKFYNEVRELYLSYSKKYNQSNEELSEVTESMMKVLEEYGDIDRS